MKVRKSPAMYQLARPVKSLLDESARFANRLSGRKCKLPDFLVIGAQKSATTALYNYLLQHPSVAKAVSKEVHYFDHRFSSSPAWYTSNFPAPDGRIIGEASPYYLVHPHVPERVHAVCPDVRLIALLRNPVQRAVSHHEHERRRGFERLPLSEALHLEEERLKGESERLIDSRYRSYALEHYSYVTRGYYASQIRRWYEFFPRSQLLILEAETLRSDPDDALSKVANFLEIPQWQPTLSDAHNRGRYPAPTGPEIDWLRDRFKAPNRELNDLLGRSFSWSIMDTGA